MIIQIKLIFFILLTIFFISCNEESNNSNSNENKIIENAESNDANIKDETKSDNEISTKVDLDQQSKDTKQTDNNKTPDRIPLTDDSSNVVEEPDYKVIIETDFETENYPPGFYKSGELWRAIIHTHSSVDRVRLVGDFTNWDDDAIELNKSGDYWIFAGNDYAFAKVPKEGDTYKFLLGSSKYIQDPAARWVENSSLKSNSKVTDSEKYKWSDSSWNRPEWNKYQIYQLHPLRFTDRNKGLNPIQQITEELNNNGTNDYLNNLGITAIELMPLNEFPGDHSWAYNPSFFYAIESSYGSPNDFKEMVDTAHKNGIAVIMDLVYNHAGSDDNILYTTDRDSYFDGDTVWGKMINFDNEVATHFFTHNAAYLAKEYHIDGLRFDATNPIHVGSYGVREHGSGGGFEFLREVRKKIKDVDPNIIMIAEELPNNWFVTKEDIGSYKGDRHAPFDSQWGDDFHDRFKDVIGGAHLDNLYNVFKNFGDSWNDIISYSESHDEVGNEDKRLAKIARDGKSYEMSMISIAATVLSRGVPMIFMGQEGAEKRQFHIDWWDDRIPLDLYETDSNRKKLLGFNSKIFEIRKNDPESFSDTNQNIAHINDGNGVFAFTRANDKYVIVLNFKGKRFNYYDLGVSGEYKEILNSSSSEFNFGTASQCINGAGSPVAISSICIPEYGVLVFQKIL